MKMQSRRKLFPRILMVLVVLLITAVLGEMIVGKFLPQKTFNKAYGDAVNCFLPDKTMLFTLKPNCNLKFENFDTGEKVSSKTNNLGYRGEDFQITKGSNEKRILVEGDSFVLGFGVSDNQVFTKQLQDQLAGLKGNFLGGAKVINAGYMGGFGPDGYFLHLKSEGMKLSPDLTIFSIFVYNDFTDMVDDDWYGSGVYGEPTKIVSNKVRVDENGYLLPIDVPFVYRIPVLRNSNLAVLTYNGLLAAEGKIKHYYDRIKFAIFKPEVPSGEARDSSFLGTYYSFCIFGQYCHRKALHLYQDMMSVVEASRKLANGPFKDNREHFLVLIIPVEFQLYPDTFKKYSSDTGIPLKAAEIADPNPQKRLRGLFDSEGISYIDLLPLMRKSKERLYFTSDGHWNSLGHQFVSNVVYNWIRDNYGNSSSR